MIRRTNELVVVAGGAGFIGTHLCTALMRQGREVLCIDNLQTAHLANLDVLMEEPNFDFIEADITEPLPRALMSHAGRISCIYNLACAASPPRYQADPEHTMLTNVLGTSNLLQLAEQAHARFLLASTSEVYGDPENHPQREDYRGWVNCTGPRACYDEGKRAAEAITFDYARLGRAEVRVARIFNTYGPFMHPDDGRVVSNLICQALRGEPITIYGDGSQTRSFCYVSDLVDGLIRLMQADIDGADPVNLGNPEELTVLELARLVRSITGATMELVHLPLPQDDPRRRRPDISRARKWLGWEPRVSIRDGLARTCDWFADAAGVNCQSSRQAREAIAAE